MDATLNPGLQEDGYHRDPVELPIVGRQARISARFQLLSSEEWRNPRLNMWLLGGTAVGTAPISVCRRPG